MSEAGFERRGVVICNTMDVRDRRESCHLIDGMLSRGVRRREEDDDAREGFASKQRQAVAVPRHT